MLFEILNMKFNVTVWQLMLPMVCTFFLLRLKRNMNKTTKAATAAAAPIAIPESDNKTLNKKTSNDTSAVVKDLKDSPKIEDSDGSDDEDANYSIKNAYNITHGQMKMVLCVNTGLGMGKGKIAAQCGHATLGAYKIATNQCPSALRIWDRLGQAKIALKIDDEVSMKELYNRAKAAGLVAYIVMDAGRTQIAAGSQTVLAIGPAPYAAVDEITGHLKLL